MTLFIVLRWLVEHLRRPIRIRLVAPHDQAANALHGLASFLHRRADLTGRRIRIDVTIRRRDTGRRR